MQRTVIQMVNEHNKLPRLCAPFLLCLRFSAQSNEQFQAHYEANADATNTKAGTFRVISGLHLFDSYAF
jgi:hypothetical protein